MTGISMAGDSRLGFPRPPRSGLLAAADDVGGHVEYCWLRLFTPAPKLIRLPAYELGLLQQRLNEMEPVDLSKIVGNPPDWSQDNPKHYGKWPYGPEANALIAASKGGDVQQIGELLRGDNLAPDNIITALCHARENGHVDAVSYLLSCGAPISPATVSHCVLVKDYRFLSLYLDHGFDINTPMGWSTPPLLSRTFDDEELFNWMLDHGADPNARAEILDKTPLSVAVSIAPFPMIKKLFDVGGSIEHGQLLHFAIGRTEPDYMEILQFILDKGPPLNRIMYENCPGSYAMMDAMGIGTPLHSAVHNGKLEAVDFLLAHGADPTVRDPRGLTPLDWAEWGNKTAIIERLRNLGQRATGA
ncbi:hypothetical protein FQN50_003438 [Emmonsiellopsis sp. PD_5]|nr:hypothetical protein FQN50_003438 [Emmonsiellopsis sp. PD_5]